ncbi:MAG: hemerythrin domain-containing protein [Gammaproteobacteria bacterium]|nr:hemerythrin domain-containing protein [Gammaproteobacteria bacterium]
MQSEGRELLRELREDHRNMAVLLKLLDGVVKKASAGEDPDFELLGEIMRYMTVYPDAVHHPKEDILYERLRNEREDLADGLDDVTFDHAAIAELGTQLRDDVDAIVAGSPVRRDKLIADTAAYVNRLRAHMIWEEDDLFERIEEMLETQSLEFDVSDFDQIKDPIFELEVESGFKRLMSSLPTTG